MGFRFSYEYDDNTSNWKKNGHHLYQSVTDYLRQCLLTLFLFTSAKFCCTTFFYYFGLSVIMWKISKWITKKSLICWPISQYRPFLVNIVVSPLVGQYRSIVIFFDQYRNIVKKIYQYRNIVKKTGQYRNIVNPWGGLNNEVVP